MAKICLINPPLELTAENSDLNLDPKMPIGLLYLASSLENASHEVHLIDAAAEGIGVTCINKRISAFQPDYVGFSCLTSTRKVVFELTDMIKTSINPNIINILGGVHPTLAPEKCLQNSNIDIVVVGEGEIVLPRICNGIIDNELTPGVYYRDKGEIRSTGAAVRIEDLDSLPYPAYHLLPLNIYFNARPDLCLIASRGCRYHCTFCCGPQMWKERAIFRSPKSVANEIAFHKIRYPKIENFHFLDDDFTIWNRLVEFCELVKPHNVEWRCIGRIEHLDSKIITKMHDAGCKSISFGVESGSERIQYSSQKRIPLDILPAKVADLTANGIRSKAFFMIGFPDETGEEILTTIQYALDLKKYGLSDAAFMPLIPYFGTKIYETLNSQPHNEKLGEATHSLDWYGSSPSVSAKLSKYRTYPVISANPIFDGTHLRLIAKKAYDIFYAEMLHGHEITNLLQVIEEPLQCIA